MSGHWAHQPRTPQGVRTGGEWEPMQYAESGVTLTLERPGAGPGRANWRWPRVPKSFSQFSLEERNLIMRHLPYYDPEAGLDPENLDALRATIAEATTTRYTGSDENHRTISHAARLVADAHGGVHQMAIDAGRHVASRAEDLAGITDEEAGSVSSRARESAQARYDEAVRAVTEYREAHFAKPTDPDLLAEMGSAFDQLNLSRLGTDEETMSAVTAISQARRQALSEVIELGGELNLHSDSQRKAIGPFTQAATKFPASWLDRAADQGQLMVRYSTARNHYSAGHVSKKEQTVPHTREINVEPGTQDDQGPMFEPVRLVGTTTGPDGRPVETWEFQEYEVASATGFSQQWDRERASNRRSWNGTKATGRWLPSGDGKTERRALKKVTEVVKEAVPMANTGSVKGPATIHGPEGGHGVSTAAHELTHHMEKQVPGLYELERAFWSARTRDSEYQSYMGKRNEVVKDGGFVDIYVGKDYNRHPGLGGEHRATEVASMGMEALFHGRYGAFAGTSGRKADPQMRDFMLGALVAVDPSREPVRTGIPVYSPPGHILANPELRNCSGETIVDQQTLPDGRVRITTRSGKVGEVDPEAIVVG